MSATELVYQIGKLIDRKLTDVHTAIPGEIVSLDYETATVTVRPILKYVKPNGEKIDYPDIPKVPIVFPQGGMQNASIVYPIKKGDTCLLIISERSLDLFNLGYDTKTNLMHNITNAICIPGLFREANEWTRIANDENALILSVGANAPEEDAEPIDTSNAENIIGSYIKITENEIYMTSKKIHLDSPEVIGIMQNTVEVEDEEEEDTGGVVGTLLTAGTGWWSSAINKTTNNSKTTAKKKSSTKKKWWQIW